MTDKTIQPPELRPAPQPPAAVSPSTAGGAGTFRGRALPAPERHRRRAYRQCAGSPPPTDRVGDAPPSTARMSTALPSVRPISQPPAKAPVGSPSMARSSPAASSRANPCGPVRRRPSPPAARCRAAPMPLSWSNIAAGRRRRHRGGAPQPPASSSRMPVRHRQRRTAAARRRDHRLARDRHAGACGIASVPVAETACRHPVDRRRTGAARPPLSRPASTI